MAFTAKGHFPFCYGDDGGTVLVTGHIAGIGSGKPFPVQLTLREAWEWFWEVRDWDYSLTLGFTDELNSTCSNPSPPPSDLDYTRTRTGAATIAGTLELAAGRDGQVPDEQRKLLCCTTGLGSGCHSMGDTDNAPGGAGWSITYDESACGTDSSGSYSAGAVVLGLFEGDGEYVDAAAVVWPDRGVDQVYPYLVLGITVAGTVPMYFSSLQLTDYVSAGSITIDGKTLAMYGPDGSSISGSITRGTAW